MKLVIATLIALCFCTSSYAVPPSGYSCTKNTITTTSSSGVTQIVAANGGAAIRICAVYYQIQQTSSAANFSLVTGTGTSCGTGQSNATFVYLGFASTTQNYSQSVTNDVGWFLPGGNALCLNLSAAPTSANVQVFFDYY